MRVDALERCRTIVLSLLSVVDALTGTGHVSSLVDISPKLTDLAQENAFRRAINRVADADLIQGLNKEVDECFNNFMVCVCTGTIHFPLGLCSVDMIFSKLGTQLATGMDVKYLRESVISLVLLACLMNLC
jgi:hypothetical protein